MKLNTLLFFLLLSLMVNAQDKIQVLDETLKTPMEGVTVSSDKVATVTDSKGFFLRKKIASQSQKDSLTFSFVGYVTKKIAIADLKNGIVYMTAKAEPLGQVMVTGDRPTLQNELRVTELAPIKNAVFGFGAVLVDNKIYVLGGDRSVKDAYYDYYEWENNTGKLQVYDIETDTWSMSDHNFLKRAYHNIHYNNGRIYVLGGKRLAKNPKLEYLCGELEVYDIQLDTIVVSKINPHAAVNFASSVYNNNIIVMGGSTRKNLNNKKFTNKAHSLDLKTGYWYELADMPYAKETKSIEVDGIMYLIGGLSKKILSDIYSYNISTGAYNLERTLEIELERPALAYNAHIIYMLENDKLYTYNIQTKDMAAYRLDKITLKYSEIVYKDGFLYVISGRNGARDVRSPTEDSLIGGALRSSSIEYPSERLYRIDLSDLKHTERNRVGE